MVPPIPSEPIKHERQKGYLVKYSYDSDFVNCMLRLEDQYPEEVFSIQGIASKSLDVVEFSRNFFKKSADQSVAEHSVDGNANVNDKSIHTYVCETPKAIWKLNSLFLLWKWVHRLYGKDSADLCLEKVISGELFVNDMTGFHMPYCFAFDLRKLTTEGMSFFNGNFPIKAPKRSDSFNDLVNQATAYISNQIMGAASYPNYFPILDSFYRKEFGQDYMAQIRAGTIDKRDLKTIRNQFQNLIYSLNFPFRGSQSAFTNLSVLDRGFCTNLFSDHVFVDPETNEIDMAADHFDSIIELSKFFFEYYTEINGKEGMFTFPVMTIAISLDDNGEYIDPEFARWAAKYNCDKALANIFQDRPTSFSSCCFAGQETIKVKNIETNEVEVLKMIDFVRRFVTSGPITATLDKDGPIMLEKKISGYKIISLNPLTGQEEETEISGILKKQNDNGLLVKITMPNGSILEVTSDHVFLAKRIADDVELEIKAIELSKNPTAYLLPIE